MEVVVPDELLKALIVSCAVVSLGAAVWEVGGELRRRVAARRHEARWLDRIERGGLVVIAVAAIAVGTVANAPPAAAVTENDLGDTHAFPATCPVGERTTEGTEQKPCESETHTVHGVTWRWVARWYYSPAGPFGGVNVWNVQVGVQYVSGSLSDSNPPSVCMRYSIADGSSHVACDQVGAGDKTPYTTWGPVYLHYRRSPAGSMPNPVQMATSISHWWVDGCRVGETPSRTGDFEACGGDEGDPPAPPEAVPTPAAACGRDLVVNADGTTTVKVAGAAANPHAEATDTVRWRLPWDADWRTGPAHSSQLPPASEQPVGGWRLICEVTRTINPASTATGSGRWAADSPQTLFDLDVDAMGDSPLQRSLVGPVTGLPTNLPWIITKPHPTQVPIPPAPAPGAPIPTTPIPGSAPSTWTQIGAAAGAGVAGYLAGGVLGSLGLDDALGQDKGWLCRWNPGYRFTSPNVCEQFVGSDQPVLRSQMQLLRPDGQPATSAEATSWRTAIAVGEVLVDLARPELGARTAVVVEDPATTPTGEPTLSPAQQEELEELTGEEPDDECPTGLGLLNPLNFVKAMKCVLRWAFVPEGDLMGDTWTDLQERFPFTVLGQLTELTQAIIGKGDESKTASSCPAVDFRGILEPLGAPIEDDEPLFVRAPTPTGSGCIGAGGVAGDVAGHRELLRNLAVAALWFVVLRHVAASVGPKQDPTGGVT